MAKALVVDDESDARDFVRAILEGDGWEVVEAADGAEGIQQAKAARPELIVLDVQMPKKDGFTVFSELAECPEARGSKVIMLTGIRAKVGIGFSAEEMGDFIGRKPDAYVEKPIDVESFKRTVKKVMAV